MMIRPCENEAGIGRNPVLAADEVASQSRDWLSSDASGIGAALPCPAIVARHDKVTR